MSAERQSREPEEAVDDADMSMDDVFSVASQRDVHRERHATEEAGHIDTSETSPGLAPHVSDNDESVPPLESSSSSSSRAPVPVPNHAGSMGSRRLSVRSVGSPVDGPGLSTTPGSNTRRSPYSIPSRSPGAMGPLSQAYAMSMTPSHGPPRSTARMPPWTGGRAVPRRAVQPSTSAPVHHAVFALDEDETDDEPGLPDDDATEDESEFERARSRGYTSSHSRSPSPAYSYDAMYDDDDHFSRRHGWRRTRDDRYVYAGMRATPGLPHARAMPLPRARPGMPYASSVPLRGYTPYAQSWSAEDSKQRSQVQMAAAALDRLSMRTEHEERREPEPPRVVDENDEVAAIRDRLGGAANCSAFISKLWHLMINPDLYGKYIHWNEAGDTIILSNDPGVAAEFASEVLPKLFKHGNNASFVRQLNLYGFQRVSSSRLLDAAELQAISAKGLGERSDAPAFGKSPTSLNTAVELYGAHSSFAHPRFRRGQEQWLSSMKPRSSKKPKRSAEDKAHMDRS